MPGSKTSSLNAPKLADICHHIQPLSFKTAQLHIIIGEQVDMDSCCTAGIRGAWGHCLDSYCHFTATALIHLVMLCLSQQAIVLLVLLILQTSRQQLSSVLREDVGRWQQLQLPTCGSWLAHLLSAAYVGSAPSNVCWL